LLHTGRTHQIRVHFLHLGFPLVGDSTYGKRQNNHLVEKIGYRAPRQMLHAQKLVFQHPRTKQKQMFHAPLPDDFKDALVALR
jgi:23S rRNA pseudouridine1911/1915/1917 synthase